MFLRYRVSGRDWLAPVLAAGRVLVVPPGAGLVFGSVHAHGAASGGPYQGVVGLFQCCAVRCSLAAHLHTARSASEPRRSTVLRIE